MIYLRIVDLYNQVRSEDVIDQVVVVLFENSTDDQYIREIFSADR